jgi:uncharacterized protein
LDQQIKPFWETKTLDEMTVSEWEQLCDGCGRCCLMKLEEEDTGEIFITRVACKLLDTRTCQCSDYACRQAKVPDCIQIDPQQVRDLKWLPETCGYRRIKDRQPLAWWHPLISGSPETVHEAGISVRGWVKSETSIKIENLHRYIIGDYPEPAAPTEAVPTARRSRAVTQQRNKPKRPQ